MFSVILPTMWLASELEHMLPRLLDHPRVGEVLLIDNDSTNPNSTWIDDHIHHPKLRYFAQRTNIGVNAAWQLGSNLATHDLLCFANDDILFDPLVFDLLWTAFEDKRCDMACADTNEIIGRAKDDFAIPTITNFRLLFVNDLRQPPYGSGMLFMLPRSNFVPLVRPELFMYFGDTLNWYVNQLSGRRVVRMSGLTIKTTPSTTVSTMSKQADIELGVGPRIMAEELSRILTPRQFIAKDNMIKELSTFVSPFNVFKYGV